MARFLDFLKRYNGFFIAAGVFGLIAFRQFDPSLLLSGRPLANWRLWALLILLVYLLFRLTAFLRSRTGGRGRSAKQNLLDDFDTSLLILAATNVVIQLTGSYESYFHPLNYLFMAMFVVYLGVRTALFYAFALPLLEAASNLLAGRPPLEIYTKVLFHTAMGITFIGLLGFFLWIERRDRDRAVDKLDRLTSDAKALAGDGSYAQPAVMRDRSATQDAHHARELDAELADLTDIARRGLGADACVALFTDSYGALLRVRAMSGDPRELDEDAMIPIDGTAPGLVLRQLKPLVIRRLDSRRTHLGWRRRESRVRSCVLHPLFNAGSPVGVIAADSLRDNAFDVESEAFLSRIADRIEEAFRAAQSVAEIDRERTEFAAYYEVVKKFSTMLTAQDVLDVTIEAGRAILPFDAAAVTFSDPERRTGTIAAAQGGPEKWIGLEFDERRSLAGWVTDTRQYLLYKRSEEITKPIYHPDCKLKGFESVLLLPLKFHENILGTLGFFWKRENAVTPYDLKLLETVSMHAAASLDSARMYDRMEQLATTDGLTGLPNHRTFQAKLDQELARFKRMHHPIALVLTDIDHFKKINDTYGHPVGDIVLKNVSAMLASTVRDVDMAARYGGEEFALVLPNTNAGGAWKFADRLRKQIAKLQIEHPGGHISVTISMGIACFPDDAADKPTLIKAADEALYHSKQTGRNKVSAYAEMK